MIERVRYHVTADVSFSADTALSGHILTSFEIYKENIGIITKKKAQDKVFL
jgi:hypothetical protein